MPDEYTGNLRNVNPFLTNDVVNTTISVIHLPPILRPLPMSHTIILVKSVYKRAIKKGQIHERNCTKE